MPQVILAHFFSQERFSHNPLLQTFSQQPKEKRLLVMVRMGFVSPLCAIFAEHYTCDQFDGFFGLRPPPFLPYGIVLREASFLWLRLAFGVVE
jgi:hypothetical protein